MLIFLLFLPWYMNAMDIELTQADIDAWLTHETQSTQMQSTNAITPTTPAPRIASPLNPSFSLNSSSAHFAHVPTPGGSHAASPEHHSISTDSDGCPSKRSSHNPRDQQTRSSESVGESQESEESSERPRKFIVHCPFQPCIWHIIYKKPCKQEVYYYLELMCVERIWRHCHETHWSLKTINEYVSEEFKHPLALEEEESL